MSDRKPTPASDGPNAPLARAWRAALERAGPQALALLRGLAAGPVAELADTFYAEMMAEPRAAPFLTHEQVRTRLQPAMRRWVADLLRATPASVDELLAAQRVVGDAHARIGIPVDLVTRGARTLKQRLHALVRAEPVAEAVRVAAMECLGASIDIALEGMTGAYATSREHASRADAVYRLFSLIQNVPAERERQRAMLLEWENRLLYALASGAPFRASCRLGISEFGTWFTHKGVPSFGEGPQTLRIAELMREIDALLAAWPDRPAADAVLEPMRERLAQIHALMGMLFEQIGEVDAGRDALTSLLNRRFLPTALRREIAQAERFGGSFALLLLDLDHFKSINDRYGHDGGDRALQHLATTLTQFTRSGDYVFRYGGEEFVVLLVSVTRSQALGIAEELRKRIAQLSVPMPDGSRLPLTASIGVAMHEGHPDYERLLARADAAMYMAKRGGRDCVFLAYEGMPDPPELAARHGDG